MKYTKFHKKGVPIVFGFLVSVMVIWIQFTDNKTIQYLVQRFENQVYDFRLRHTIDYQHYKEAPVVIVDIDERSLQTEGRWPWSRDKIATMVDKLFKSGSVVIAFDVMFTEPERNMAMPVLEQLEQLSPSAKTAVLSSKDKIISAFDNDAILANSLKGHDVVLGYILHDEDSKPIGKLPEPFQVITPEQDKRISLPRTSTYTAVLSKLGDATPLGGFLTSLRDNDGVLRRAPLILRYGDGIYPSLSLEAARVYNLVEKNEMKVITHSVGNIDHIVGVSLGQNHVIQTDGLGRVLVPFRGTRGKFPYIPATDVLNDKVKPEIFANKIVLVGTSALGLSDLQATSVDSVFPGVEVHANNIAAILEGKFPSIPAWAPGANLVILVVTSVLLVPLFAIIGPVAISIIGTSVILLSGAINVWLWVNQGIVLTLVLPVLLVVSLVLLNLAYGFLIENRKKRQITNMFGQYVSSELVNEMSEDPAAYTFEGHSKEMTVLFSDIRSFTTMSEKLTAAELKDLLNRYFEPMTEIIFKQHGTIDKYVGDMIMAFWGAPRSDEDQADHAVTAAMEMLEKTEELRKIFKATGLPEIKIGVGVNTGTMNVGDMGSKYRRAYTVLGDAVNLGSRLEASTKFYGVSLLIGETTASKLKNFVCRKLDLVKVKGKKEAVAVFAPYRIPEQPDPAFDRTNQLHEQAMNAYLASKWDEAEQLFTTLHSENPDTHVYTMYLERIADFKINPPPADWDGSYTRTEK